VTQQQYRDRSRWASGGWNRDWRNDRRYDWRGYRDRHRSIFHIGIYYDPFGYSYRPFNIGYRLQPYYYGQQYWIDPAMYSLPYPPPGTEWVRYWNDALLVDIYSGEVVDVIHGFFW
jgi:Ni/Co efflux regulator RcnB